MWRAKFLVDLYASCIGFCRDMRNCCLALFFAVLLRTACLIFVAKTLTFNFLFVAGFLMCHFLVFDNCVLTDFAFFRAPDF